MGQITIESAPLFKYSKHGESSDGCTEKKERLQAKSKEREREGKKRCKKCVRPPARHVGIGKKKSRVEKEKKKKIPVKKYMADNGQLRRKGLTIEDSTQASHGSNRLFALISKGRLNQNGLYKTIKIFLLPSASCSGCPAYLHSKGLFFFSFDRGVENKYKSRVDDRQEELYTTSTYPRGRRQGKERKNKKK